MLARRVDIANRCQVRERLLWLLFGHAILLVDTENGLAAKLGEATAVTVPVDKPR